MAGNPVRRAFLDALARRAAAHDGEVRRLLDARLAALRALPAGAGTAAPPTPVGCPATVAGAGGAATPAPTGPLGELAHRLDAHAADAGGTAAGEALPELKALQQSRRTWTRLSVGRQLAKSLAKAPGQAGPLNSHALVLRALQQMQSISPAYLERFLAHVQTLLWLDAAAQGDGPAAPRRGDAGQGGGGRGGRRGGR